MSLVAPVEQGFSDFSGGDAERLKLSGKSNIKADWHHIY